MRTILSDALTWPMDHLWQSLMITMPVAAAIKYAWAALLMGLDRLTSSRR